jgi:hypothetical protein
MLYNTINTSLIKGQKRLENQYLIKKNSLLFNGIIHLYYTSGRMASIIYILLNWLWFASRTHPFCFLQVSKKYEGREMAKFVKILMSYDNIIMKHTSCFFSRRIISRSASGYFPLESSSRSISRLLWLPRVPSLCFPLYDELLLTAIFFLTMGLASLD